MNKKVLVFSTGTPTGGGSGFQHLVENARTGVLNAEIVGVVTTYKDGGVSQHAQALGIPVYNAPGEWDATHYRLVCERFQPDLISLSGWLKFVAGIKDIPVINIHPGRLPHTAGLYGHTVHQRSLDLWQERPAFTTAVTMHFVPYQEEVDRSGLTYDTGPVFFEYPITIRPGDTAESLAARVNEYEHGWQAWATNLVVTDKIQLSSSGILTVPKDYQFLPQ